MNTRVITLFRELMAADMPLTSDYLASINQVTSRTTREDIKNLDVLLSENGAQVKSLKGKGYELSIHDDQLFRKYLKVIVQDSPSQHQNMPDLPEERIKYLIKRLLLANKHVKLDSLADELHISRSTIQNDIRNVKEILYSYGIELKSRPNYGMKISGNELKLRFCMAEYIFDRSGKSDTDIFTSQLPWLIKENLNEISTIILEQISANDITLSDIALNNLFIHIAITYKRVQAGHHVSLYPKEYKEIIDQKEYQVAHKIVGKVEEKLQITFPEIEIAYIAIHLLGTKMVSQTNISEDGLEQVIDEEVLQLTSSILGTIEDRFMLGIKHDRELIVGLVLHLKPAINRFRYGMNIRNPMLDDIKANYPVAFEAAILAGLELEEHTGARIDENEIGYIALHIGAAMERKKIQTSPKRCLVVCASGVGSAQLIYYKLKSQFGTKLDVAGTTEYYKLNQISLTNFDFLVSTIPIPDELPIPVIQVNSILGETDIKKVEGFVQEDDDHVLNFIKKDLVFLGKSLHTKNDVLEFLNRQLVKSDLVDEGFIEAVYEREALAPTSFGNFVAIPHPVTPQTDETFLTVCTLQKPILWGDKRVQFICLLSVEKNSSTDMQNLYSMLGQIVDDISIVQQILKCQTYDDLIEVLVK